MGVFSGVESWWMDTTSAGKKHAATQAVVQNGLLINVDAGVSDSYGGSGSTWTDLSSGTARNMSLVNSPSHNSSLGYFELGDSNQYINMSDCGLSGAADFTAEMWLNVDAYSTTRWWALNIGQNNTGSVHWIGEDMVSGTVTEQNMNFWNATGDSSFTNMPLADTGNWQQWTHTFNHSSNGSGAAKFYVKHATADYSDSKTHAAMNLTSTNLHIALPRVNNEAYFNFKIAAFRLYDRALTADEVQLNYDVMKGRFGI